MNVSRGSCAARTWTFSRAISIPAVWSAPHAPNSCARPVVNRHAAVQPSRMPGPQEDAEVCHEAFMHAYEHALPQDLRFPGIQQFAAAIWQRRRSIPSQAHSDPLDQIFTEFDTDDDEKLTAAEVAAALRSRGVEADERVMQRFIEAVDKSGSHVLARHEFADFILHLAAADLRSNGLPDAKTLLHLPETK